MTSVTPASDIWSVGCLAIELLTGQAPYFDLQPMSALFRIVQDAHPPLPQGISPGMLVSITPSLQLKNLMLLPASGVSTSCMASEWSCLSLIQCQRLAMLSTCSVASDCFYLPSIHCQMLALEIQFLMIEQRTMYRLPPDQGMWDFCSPQHHTSHCNGNQRDAWLKKLNMGLP